MGEIFGAAGQIGAAAISSNATKAAAKMQIDALEKQARRVYDQLEPSRIAAQATDADVTQTKQQLALQAITDPGLLAARYAGQDQLARQIGQIGQTPADVVARQATDEALAGTPALDDLKGQLIDAALQELELGATLPPDVQAELVQAGLENAGQATGSATATGIGGKPIRQLLGQEALKLKADRQGRALALGQAASQLEQNRASILQNLFPNLQNQQLSQANLAGSGVGTSAANMPNVGLSGNDIANIWLARVGAGNKIAQQQADIGAQAGMANAQIWNNALGGAANTIGTGLSKSGFSLGDVVGFF